MGPGLRRHVPCPEMNLSGGAFAGRWRAGSVEVQDGHEVEETAE
jgi:hypothetical protein